MSDLRAALAQHYNRIYLVAGVLLAVSSLPGMPAWLSFGGLEDELDLVLMAWGIGSVALFGLARLWIHRGVFVVEIVFQLAIAVWWTVGIVTGQRDLVWGLLGLLCFAGVWLSVRQYRRFGQLPRA